MTLHTDIGVVVIGRNEGDRLERCLRSVTGRVAGVVYVDSGSTDGSVELARALGAGVVELDTSIPFSAARARNEGSRRLLEAAPGVAFVQFVDGDCEVIDGWLETARNALVDAPSLGVVCGRRRERFPSMSVYNRLCDLEWDTPAGEALACGGDAMIRVRAFLEVGGYDASLIAGEEPEMCFRLRARGWGIRRLDAEMTLHDAAMRRFGQWWKRAVRAGHAAAEGAWLHGGSAERYNVRRVARALAWGAALPIASLALAWVTSGTGALLLAAYPIQCLSVASRERRRGRSDHDAALAAVFSLVDKFAQTAGILRYLNGIATGRRSRLIEYKGRHPRAGAILYVGAVVPARSETFVYREILALRARGVKVEVASVRPAPDEFEDPELAAMAREHVRVYGGGGALAILKDCLRELVSHPVRTIRTIGTGIGDVVFRWEAPRRRPGADGRREEAIRRVKVPAQCAAGVALAHRVRERRITHIHAHMAHVPTTIAMYAARQLGIGFSFTGHANDLFRERTILGVKLRRARFTACISEWHRRWYRDIEPVAESRLPVVRCGVDTAHFVPAPRRSDGLLRVLSVGRLVEKKGHRVLIEAMAQVGWEGRELGAPAGEPPAPGGVELTIVGDGPERAGLEELIARTRTGDRVRLAGALPNERVRELLREASVFCLACVRDSEGDMDGIPVVLMEAMASGVAVIAGDLPAIRELVEDGKTGLLVPPGDARECARALERLLADADERVRLGEAGRRRVEEEFSQDVNVGRLLAALERVGATERSTAGGPSRLVEGRKIGQDDRTAA